MEVAQDVVKSLIQWVSVSVLGFFYWMFVLLLISLFLMGVWFTTFDDILRYGIILAVITSIGYAGVMIYRKVR